MLAVALLLAVYGEAETLGETLGEDETLGVQETVETVITRILLLTESEM